MKKLKKGGVQKGLEQRINESKDFLTYLEEKINENTVQMTRLNYEYKETFKPYWFFNKSNKDILTYRQSIIDNINLINKYNIMYKNSLIKIQDNCNLYEKIYNLFNN